VCIQVKTRDAWKSFYLQLTVRECPRYLSRQIQEMDDKLHENDLLRWPHGCAESSASFLQFSGLYRGCTSGLCRGMWICPLWLVVALPLDDKGMKLDLNVGLCLVIGEGS